MLTVSEAFAIVGVNAVTARGRANTSYAIPSPAVAAFIEHTLKHIYTVNNLDGSVQSQTEMMESALIKVKQQAPFFDVYSLKVSAK